MPNRLPLGTKLAWGIGGVADNLIPNVLAALALPIYNLLFGLDVVLIGIALAIPRFLDALVDPYMGNISDQARSRWGRRKPYIVLGATLCAVLLPFFWAPVFGKSETALFLQLLLLGCVYSFSYTVFVIPYTALGYEITPDYDDRTRLLAWRMYLGLLAGLAIPWLYKLTFVTEFGATQEKAVLVLSWLIAVVIFATGAAPGFLVREHVPKEMEEKLTFWTSLRTAMRNRPFALILTGYCAVLIGLFTVSSLALYLNIFLVCGGDKQQAAYYGGLGGMASAVGSYLGLLAISKVAGLLGKGVAMTTALGLALIGFLSLLVTLTPAAPYFQLVSFFIQGFALQGAWLMVSSMVADVCDEDELETGRRREGIFSAVTSFVQKLLLSLTALTGGVVLKLCGYQDNVTPSDATNTAMKLTFILIPSLTLFVAILIFRKYPITRQRAERTRALLAERLAAPSP